MSSSKFKARRRHLLACAKEEGAHSLLIEEPIDLFYLTGLQLSQGTLLLSPRKERLFVDGRYIAAAKEKADLPVELIDAIQHHFSLKTEISLDDQTMSHARFLFWKKRARVKPLSYPFRIHRLIKSREEIASLRKSAALNARAMRYAMKELRVGMTEQELGRAIEIFALKEGAEGVSFPPIIAFGENSAYPHHRASKRKYNQGEVALIDIGMRVENYVSDMTRTLVPKEASQALQRLNSLVLDAFQEAFNLCKPGIRTGEPDRIVRWLFKQEKVESLFQHSLGHGVGLEVHEAPRLREGGEWAEMKFCPGMVVTLEPGLYQAGVGGIRYEDTILITDTGAENFYN